MMFLFFLLLVIFFLTYLENYQLNLFKDPAFGFTDTL